MPERLDEAMLQFNEDGVRVAPSQYTQWIEQQSLTTEGDPTTPNAPSMTASAASKAIDLKITKPTRNTDGSLLYDLSYYEVFYATSSGIVIEDPATYTASFTTTSTQHTFPCEATHFFRSVAWDKYENRSSGSSEVSATPNTTGLVVSVDDYTNNISNVYTGSNLIGILFQPPKSTWSRFLEWKLYYDVDTGGGWSGTWTQLYRGPGPAFLHKGLNENYKYKYKLAVLGEDGTETSGTVSDNSGGGYRPNESNNTALLAVDVFAERIIASREMIARTFIGGKLQSTNWSTVAGTELDLDSATLKLGGSTSPKLSWNGTTLSVSGTVTSTSGTIGGWTLASSSLTGGSATLHSTGYATLGTGNDIVRIDATDATYRLWAGNATAASAPFRVTKAGALTATSATITGGYLGSTTAVTISSTGLNVGTSGTIYGGATGYNSGTGFWMGYSSGYKLFIGNSSGNKLLWTGSALEITGKIVCGSGSTYSGLGGLAYLGSVGASECDSTIISGGKIVTGLLTASNIKTGTLDCSTITVSNLSASSITTGSLSATRLSGGTLNFSAITRSALSVLASELAGGITFDKISSVSATTITTGTLTAVTVQTSSGHPRAFMSPALLGYSHVIGTTDSSGYVRTCMSGWDIFANYGGNIRAKLSSGSNYGELFLYGSGGVNGVRIYDPDGGQVWLALNNISLTTSRSELNSYLNVNVNGTVRYLRLYS